MKSCLSIIAVILTLILFLTACKKNETEFILSGFESEVSFRCEETEYKGDFIMKNKDEMVFKVKSPEDIKDCEFTYKNGETSVSFDGVVIGVMDTSPLKTVFDTLNFLAEKPLEINENGDVIFSDEKVNIATQVVVDIDSLTIKEICKGDMVYIFTQK